MADLNISEVSIEPLPSRDGLIGFSSFVINNQFKISNVAIHTCLSHHSGIRLVFPNKEYKGLRLNTVHPITKEAYESCVTVVAQGYSELMGKLR